MTNKKFITFILISALFLSPLLFASQAEAKPKGSQISGEHIEGKTDQEVRDLLEEAIQSWQAGDDLLLTSEYEIFEFPRTGVTFDIEATIEAFNQQTKRTFSSFFMKPKNVHLPLHVKMNSANNTVQDMKQRTYIHIDETFSDVLGIASELGSGNITITYGDEQKIPFAAVSEITIDLDEITNATLKQSLSDLDEQKIEANDSFSFIQNILVDDRSKDVNEEASFIAGKMYSLFLETNFQIAERSIHPTPPAHSKAGFDVRIDFKNYKDFIVVNPNETSFLFDVEETGNELTVTLTSAHHTDSYDVELEEKEIQPRIVYRYNDKLAAGEQDVIQKGVSGTSVIVERLTYTDGRDFRDTEFISHDIYTLIPTIILVSYKDEETIQEETIEEQVDELEDTIDGFESQLDEVREEAASNAESTEMIASLAEQLQNIQVQQAEFMGLIAALQEQMNTNESPSNDEIDERIHQQLDGLYDTLEERLTAIDERLAALEEQIGGFDAQSE